jgi:hypothetical protein
MHADIFQHTVAIGGVKTVHKNARNPFSHPTVPPHCSITWTLF